MMKHKNMPDRDGLLYIVFITLAMAMIFVGSVGLSYFFLCQKHHLDLDILSASTYLMVSVGVGVAIILAEMSKGLEDMTNMECTYVVVGMFRGVAFLANVFVVVGGSVAVIGAYGMWNIMDTDAEYFCKQMPLLPTAINVIIAMIELPIMLSLNVFN